MYDTPEKTFGEPSSSPAEVPQPLSLFDAEESDRILLKLPGVVTPTSRPEDRVSPALTDSLEKLVELVANLRSPGGGWQSDPPQTPEHLLPYVTEEMGDVLNALEDEKSAPQSKKEPITQSEIIALNDIVPLLLWHLARSAEDTLRLLTGIEAKVTAADGTWNRGILRLVAGLTLKTSQTQEAIDLATRHPPQFNLPAEAMIQSGDCRFCQYPLDAKSLLERLQNTIDQRFPAIANLKSQPITLLYPGYNWQVGQLSLTLGWEFLANPPSFEHTFESSSVETIDESPRALLSSQLKLTDTVVLSRYVRESIRQQLAIPLKHLFLGQHESPPEAFEPFLLARTSEFAERVYSGLPTPEPQLVPPQLNLGRLTSKLLWHMVSGDRAIVRLIGGISARVLQPGHRWERGTVRLVAILNADFTGSHWEIDITTRETPQLTGTLLAEDAVIDWENLQEIGSALAEIGKKFREVSPELGIWMDGVEVDWAESTAGERMWRSASEVRSGLVQLVFSLEWVPIPRPASEDAES
ncbi:hypothetical protein [Lyngbya sp. CCY1209]|uniref:hypothetical protein n=1 Tax=Lyngbya sp. CCY1209 TaxID=2886103 RepID=UPI002D1FCD1C|nr:hypothetical protein [Lyngbya sp. CCY1209]MEB3882070.1 hypothetical protein [Lyngbya sp. CCY1209]